MFEDDDNLQYVEPITKRSEKVWRPKKRYVNTRKKSTAFADEERKYDTRITECLADKLFHIKDPKLPTVHDNNWVKVKSKRKKLTKKKKEDFEPYMKHRRSINGVFLEPGVTYIGKAVKTFYRSHDKNKQNDTKEYKVCQNQENKEKDISVQTYAETLLCIYSSSVKSPHSMNMFNEASKQIERKQNQSYADVTSRVCPLSKPHFDVEVNVEGCNVFKKMEYLRQYRVHAGGKKRKGQGRNSKGWFTKRNHNLNDNCSVSQLNKKGDIRIGKDERNVNVHSNETDFVNSSACQKNELSKEHICNMETGSMIDQVELHIDFEEKCSSDMDTSIMHTDSNTGLGNSEIEPSTLEEINTTCEHVMTVKDIDDNACETHIFPDVMLKDSSNNATLIEKNKQTDQFNCTNTLETVSEANVINAIVTGKKDSLYTNCKESEEEVQFISNLGMHDRPDKFLKFVPLEQDKES
ncbi:uncharacterized protein LOC121430293 [Lytechinus variegatus]|uniref:uncharacterized protein LOC121430293 n=1 Tax=Lytechinus variegatus TaxID=7654 RepID=UPI001BB1D4D6|nr:uncharacterized protein LOC121430293 [Lytechinus variegatus]